MKNNEFEIQFKKGTQIEQIERASFIVHTIFNSLESAAILPVDEERFQTETIILSQIGAAFVGTIYENISKFIEPDEDKEYINPDDEPIVYDVFNARELSFALSGILNNPNLPVTLYNAFQNAIAEVYSGGDGAILNKFESSPEFMKAVIDACEKKSEASKEAD